MWKTQIVTKPKNFNCDKTQKLKLWHSSKTQIVTKIQLGTFQHLDNQWDVLWAAFCDFCDVSFCILWWCPVMFLTHSMSEKNNYCQTLEGSIFEFAWLFVRFVGWLVVHCHTFVRQSGGWWTLGDLSLAFWCPFGGLLLAFWYPFGSLLVTFWWSFGSLLVTFWCLFGGLLVTF